MTQRSSILGLLVGLALWLDGPASILRAQALRASADPVVITLAPEAVVDDSLVELGQIARLSGGPDGLRTRLSRLDVAEFTLGARQAVIASEQVRFRLLLAGADERQYELRGAKRTFINESDAPCTFRGLALAAEEAVRAQYSRGTAAMPVTVHRGIEVPALDLRPGERCRLEAKVKAAPPRTGLALVDVALMVNGKKRAVVAVSLEVGESPTILTVAPDRGAVRPALFTAPAKVDEPFLVKARDNVKIVARIGSARIEAHGEALQDGHAGEVIRVRNTESGRTVLGRIEAGGLIVVDY